MEKWSLADILAVISALTAAIVSIINAYRGREINDKVDQVSQQVQHHEENATERAKLRGEIQQPAPYDPNRPPPIR